MGRSLILFIASICGSCSGLVLDNTIQSYDQRQRIDLLERWALRSEVARLEATPVGQSMIAHADGATISIQTSDLFPDMIVSDIQAWLVPHGEDWEFLREVVSRREHWEPLSASLIRHCEVGPRGPVTFSSVPEGGYDLIAVFKGSEHDPARGTRVRRHAFVEVQGQAWTTTDFRTVSPTEFKFNPSSSPVGSSAPQE